MQREALSLTIPTDIVCIYNHVKPIFTSYKYCTFLRSKSGLKYFIMRLNMTAKKVKRSLCEVNSSSLVNCSLQIVAHPSLCDIFLVCLDRELLDGFIVVSFSFSQIFVFFQVCFSRKQLGYAPNNGGSSNRYHTRLQSN